MKSIEKHSKTPRVIVVKRYQKVPKLENTTQSEKRDFRKRKSQQEVFGRYLGGGRYLQDLLHVDSLPDAKAFETPVEFFEVRHAHPRGLSPLSLQTFSLLVAILFPRKLEKIE